MVHNMLDDTTYLHSVRQWLSNTLCRNTEKRQRAEFLQTGESENGTQVWNSYVLSTQYGSG